MNKRAFSIAILLLFIGNFILQGEENSNTLFVDNGKKKEVKKTSSTTIEGDKIIRKETTVTSYKQNKKYHYNWRYRGTFPIFSFGLLYTIDNFSKFNEAGGFNANISKEVSLNPLQHTVRIYRNSISFTSGIGMTWRNLHVDNNKHFVKSDDNVTVEPAPEDLKYRFSRLRTFDLNVPFYFNFFPANNKDFFISGGVLLGANTFSSAKVKYRNEANKKVKEVEAKNLYINPFSVSYVAQVGFNSVGAYAKYTPTNFFRTDKGPEFQTFSLGLSLIL